MTPVKDPTKSKEFYRSMVLLIILVPLRALLLMVSLGILHLQWSQAVPALGFWSCVILSMTYTGLIRR